MHQLSGGDLKTLEEELKNYLPMSQQMYGYISLLNRTGQSADPVSVFADQWPEFNVLLIKPECREKGDLFKDMAVFSKNESFLRNLLVQTSVINWNVFICLAAEDRNEPMIKSLAVNKDVPVNKAAVCHMLVLQEPLKLPAVDSRLLKMSSLNESHLDLVNSAWKFGCDLSKVMIRNMILNFPSRCVLGSDDEPVAWILTYPSCAMGMLYTVPEHRGKGYAKALVKNMSQELHNQGYPVYCFIEEENHLSYHLFKSLGFTENPEYRAAWFVFNES